MNILENKRVYLSMPMEHDKDGNAWKHSVKEILKNKYKLRIFDPSEDPKQNLLEKINYYRENSMYDEVRKVARFFVKKDLTLVNKSDIVIAYLPHGTITTGIHHEIINSCNAKQLTLLVEGGDKRKLPLWYHGFINSKFMFGKWEELYDFLDDVCADKHIEDEKLFFLYNYPSEWLS